MSLFTGKQSRAIAGTDMSWNTWAFAKVATEPKYDVAQKPNLPMQIKAAVVAAIRRRASWI